MSETPSIEEFTGWRKSIWSHDNGCVEIADGPGGWVAVRDTKDGGVGPTLRFTAAEWSAFTAGVRDRSLTD